MRIRYCFDAEVAHFTLRRSLMYALIGGLLFALAPVCLVAGSQIDACSLVSASEAGAILGTHITVHTVDTSAAGPGAASMCRYSGGGIQGGFMLLAARLKVNNLGKEVASQKAEIRQDMKEHLNMTPKIKDVKGLGDAAFLVDMQGFLQLHVFAKGAKIVVNRNTRATPAVISQTKKIARTALSHLP